MKICLTQIKAQCGEIHSCLRAGVGRLTPRQFHIHSQATSSWSWSMLGDDFRVNGMQRRQAGRQCHWFHFDYGAHKETLMVSNRSRGPVPSPSQSPLPLPFPQLLPHSRRGRHVREKAAKVIDWLWDLARHCSKEGECNWLSTASPSPSPSSSSWSADYVLKVQPERVISLWIH